MVKVYQNPNDELRSNFFSVFGLTPSLDLKNLTNFKFIFIHDGDKPKMTDDNFNSFNAEIKKFTGWKIFYSGGNSGREEVDETSKVVTGLAWSTIEDKFKDFQEGIQSKANLESVFILIGYDPELENKLSPFESASPYETTNEQGKVLKDAKAELQTYVREYLEKQSKA